MTQPLILVTGGAGFLAIAAWLSVAGAAPVAVAGSPGTANSTAIASLQWHEYLAEVPKSILELQPFRHTSTLQFGTVSTGGTATLIDLNPAAQDWYLLTLHWATPDRTASYALENPRPHTSRLVLDDAVPYGVQLLRNGQLFPCTLWQDSDAPPLQKAEATGLPYAPLCGDRLFLRNHVAGAYTHLERVTNFLRDHVWGGDQMVGLVKRELFVDAFMEGSGTSSPAPVPQPPATSPAGLATPSLRPEAAGSVVIPEHLGIDLGMAQQPLYLGRWYPVAGVAGMFLSPIQPEAISRPAPTGGSSSVNALDPVEGGAVDYVVAMDLKLFDLGFVLGTDHPRVYWSQRVLDTERDPALQGPDGIGGIAPLVANGIVNPLTVESIAAAFAGGFKREHGAFHYGALAHRDHGSHYGFIEQGVIFSKLQPGLATLLVMDDGRVLMKTWTSNDDALLRQVRFARQNGVPLIDYDETTGKSSPGVLVNQWGPGNWGGSVNERLRSLRAGLCIEVTPSAQYLLFGYFSTATPSAMTRVFQAYGCRYAMHLDMNALEHTYFAVYTRRAGKLVVQHLIDGMAAVDRKGGNALAPRFLSFPDNRDFFYLTRKENPGP
jgi:hypothetical protein